MQFADGRVDIRLAESVRESEFALAIGDYVGDSPAVHRPEIAVGDDMLFDEMQAADHVAGRNRKMEQIVVAEGIDGGAVRLAQKNMDRPIGSHRGSLKLGVGDQHASVIGTRIESL